MGEGASAGRPVQQAGQAAAVPCSAPGRLESRANWMSSSCHCTLAWQPRVRRRESHAQRAAGPGCLGGFELIQFAEFPGTSLWWSWAGPRTWRRA